MGLSTLRVGLEKSRNLMTVRIAQNLGIDKIAKFSQRSLEYIRKSRGITFNIFRISRNNFIKINFCLLSICEWWKIG